MLLTLIFCPPGKTKVMKFAVSMLQVLAIACHHLHNFNFQVSDLAPHDIEAYLGHLG